MEKTKVKIINMVNHRVGLIAPEMGYKQVLPTKNSYVIVDKDRLEQLLFNESIRNMIDDCIIYIEDMEVKKELGLEPVDAEEPTNIIPLTEERMAQLMGAMVLNKFEKAVDALSMSQLNELCDYAIKKRITNYDKCMYLKSKNGRDILRAIELSSQNED